MDNHELENGGFKGSRTQRPKPSLLGPHVYSDKCTLVWPSVVVTSTVSVSADPRYLESVAAIDLRSSHGIFVALGTPCIGVT